VKEVWVVYKYTWWPTKYQVSGTSEEMANFIADLKNKKDIEYFRVNEGPESLKKGE
jgi:hypothetical protein